MKKKVINERKNRSVTPEWYLDQNGILFVSGEGKMKDYPGNDENTTPPWAPVKNQIRVLCLGEGLTELGGHAFEACENLEKVLLPGTLSKIHHSCFKNCTKLNEVIVSDEKEFYHAMEDTVRMAKREVASRRRGAKLGDIFFGTHAFLEVPWAIKRWGDLYINNHVLYACFHVSDHVTVPEGVEVIRPFVFEGLNVTSVELPLSLKEIHRFAMADTKMERVVIPERIRLVEEYAFAGSPLEKAFVPYERENQVPMKAFKETRIAAANSKEQMKRYPEAYRLVSVPELKMVIPGSDTKEMEKYKKLYIKEKNAEISEVTGVSLGMAATKALNVGQGILRRLYRNMLVICILYDEQKKTVQGMKSYRYFKQLTFGGESVIYEKELKLCYKTVDGMKQVRAADVEYQTLEKEMIRNRFFIREMPKEVVDTGQIHLREDLLREDWYCVPSRYKLSVTQEEEFLAAWMEAHPEYRLSE